jgi:hypothetical protein
VGTVKSGAAFSTGDFNGDGKPDLVAATINGQIVCFQNGGGTFTSSTTTIGTSVGGIAVGDFNGHGALVTQPCPLAMDAVSTPARFIAEVELTMSREPLRHLVYGFQRVRDHTMNRTGPLRPSSATLMEMVAL